MEILDLFKDWTPEMIEAVKATGRGSRQALRTQDEIDSFRETMSKVRSNKSIEDQVRWSLNSAEGIRQAWADKSQESRESFSSMVRGTWASRSQEELDSISKNASIKSKEVWSKKTLKEKEEFSKAVSKGSKRLWANRSPKDLEEFRQAVIKGREGFWDRLSQEEKDRWVLNAAKGQNRPPSFSEYSLGIYLEGNFPGRWVYSGNGKENIVIGNKIPDFYNRESKSEVIEILGGLGYFHSSRSEEYKVEHYLKFGYKCIVIWEWDCYSIRDLDSIFKGRGVSNC